MEPNVDNIYVKRKILDWFIEAKGRAPGTIKKYEQALNFWDKITDHADYKSFNSKLAKKFKKELAKQTYSGKLISSSTGVSVLICLKRFFEILSLQPGYRRKINLSDIAYLSPKRDDLAMYRSSNPPIYPTFQQMKAICFNQQINTEIDMMHQAMACFLSCTAARLDAVASFSVGCFNPDILLADQDPKRGVRTKGRKHIRTYLFRFDEDMVNIILNWHKYLLEKGFSYSDPMFSACETKRVDGLSFADSDTLSHNFLTAQRVYDIIKQIALNAGLEKSFNPHSFRHGVIAIAQSKAVTWEQKKAVSMNVGHSKIATTDDYAQLTDAQIKDNIRNLNIVKNKGEKSPVSKDMLERFLLFEKFVSTHAESDK